MVENEIPIEAKKVDKELEEEFKEKENMLDSIINSAFQSMLDENVATTLSTSQMETSETELLPQSSKESIEHEVSSSSDVHHHLMEQQSIETTSSEQETTSTPIVEYLQSTPLMTSTTRQRTKDEAKATISAILSQRMRSEGFDHKHECEHVHQTTDTTANFEDFIQVGQQHDPATLQSSLLQFGLALVVFFILKYFFGL